MRPKDKKKSNINLEKKKKEAQEQLQAVSAVSTSLVYSELRATRVGCWSPQMVLFLVLFQRGVQARRSAGPGAEGLEAPLGFVTWAWHTRGDGPLVYAGRVSKEPTAGEGLLAGRQGKVLYVPRKRRTWGAGACLFSVSFHSCFF